MRIYQPELDVLILPSSMEIEPRRHDGHDAKYEEGFTTEDAELRRGKN
ncbi:MAG: hypothetical protein GXP26_17590 [Planctomycetes bacterium]|nr:hypothetical protein [Planctomycetota bacterium]